MMMENNTMRNFLLLLVAKWMISGTLVAAPQAVVFDFGGVLTGEQRREAVVDFIQQSFKLSKEEFESLNQEKRLALKQGKTDEAFWLSYAQSKGIELPADWGKRFFQKMKEAIGVNSQMYALVAELQEKKIAVAMLSNIDERLSKLIRDFGFYEPFTPCLLSCDIGVAKPDPRAYEILIDRLNLPARDILFIDDRFENISAAKEKGIDAILFESEGQLREELNIRKIL